MITSQLPVKKWHVAIGDQMLADAILDRLVHNSHRLEHNGKSMRGDSRLRRTSGRHLVLCYGCILGPTQTARPLKGMSHKQAAYLS